MNSDSRIKNIEQAKLLIKAQQLEKLEKEKQDQIKVICMTQVTTGEKLIQAQAKLSLVEDSIQTLKKHLTA